MKSRKDATNVLKGVYTAEVDILDHVLPREVVDAQKELKRSRRPEYPPGMTVLIKREVAFFQRKIRAYRKVKNHLLTADVRLRKREAEVKNWGGPPEWAIPQTSARTSESDRKGIG